VTAEIYDTYDTRYSEKSSSVTYSRITCCRATADRAPATLSITKPFESVKHGSGDHD